MSQISSVSFQRGCKRIYASGAVTSKKRGGCAPHAAITLDKRAVPCNKDLLACIPNL